MLRRLDFDENHENDKHKVKLKLKQMQKENFHPNIVRIYDVFEAESSIYIITEYCEVNSVRYQSELYAPQPRNWQILAP